MLQVKQCRFKNLKLGLTCERQHMGFMFLCLSCFVWFFSCFIHLLSNFLMSFLFTTEQNFFGSVYHIFLTHFSVHGHLGQLHFLATVNRAAVSWMNKYLCSRMYSPLGICSWFLLVVVLCLAFKESSRLISVQSVPVHIPTNSVHTCSSFLATLTVFWFLCISHFEWMRRINASSLMQMGQNWHVES